MLAGRLLKPALIALAIGALGLSGCGVDAGDQVTATAASGSGGPAATGGTSTPPSTGGGEPVEPFAATGGVVFLHQAAETTAEVRSAGFHMTMEMSGVPGMGNTLMTTEGVMDMETERSHMTMDMGDIFAMEGMEGMEGIDLSAMSTMEMISDGDTVYIKSGMFSMLGIQGWVRTDAEGASSTTGATSGSPTGMVEFLQGAGDDYEVVGTEDVRGVATTHVRATLDLVTLMEDLTPAERAEMEAELEQMGAAGSGFRSIPAEAWVDDDGLVRRFTMTFDLTGTGDAEMDGVIMKLTVEMFDINEPVDITIPDPSEVTDITEMGMMGTDVFGD